VSKTNLLDRYRKLNDLARDLASTLELSALLDRIVAAASDLSDAQAASIMLYDEGAQELHFETSTLENNTQMHGMVIPVEDSIAGWVVNNRQPIIISNAQNDPRHYQEVAELTGIITDSLLGVPLTAKDKVIGVLEAINKRSGDFTSEDQDILLALGAQAAVAIENTRLFQQSDQISELIHELRTPLTSINMSAKLLIDPKYPEESRLELVEMILGETKRLTDLTTDFLDLSRLETGRIQYQHHDIDLVSLLPACVQLVTPQAEQAGIKMILGVPKTLPVMRGDYDKIKQVLINLLSNAIKYNQVDGKVILSASSNQDEIILTVQDTGVGIPEESLPHIFEKFYRAPDRDQHIDGTGLGLLICKRIVEDHNGYIEVTSQQDIGTTFSLHFPII
jgi:signal transduction histidine kinase